MNAEIDSRLAVGSTYTVQTGAKLASEAVSPGVNGASTRVVSDSGAMPINTGTEKTEESSNSGLLQRTAKVDEVPVAAAVNEAANTIEDFIGKNQRNLSFERDLDSGVMVISVIDKESNDVIRKIPGEEAIAIAKRIRELHDEITTSQGVFFEKEV